jgi:hypothetical protein
MNTIILPPAILSALLPNHTRIEGYNNNVYLLRENFRVHRSTISELYQLFFGKKIEPKGLLLNENPTDVSPEYFSSYE